MFCPSTVVTAGVLAARIFASNAARVAGWSCKIELQDRVAGDTIGPAASCELDSVPSPKVVGGGGDDKLLRIFLNALVVVTCRCRLEELLLSALITGGGSSDGNSTCEVGAADGSAVVALANEAGGGVAASAVASLAIADGGGVAAAGAAVAALAVAAGGEAGVFGSSVGFRRASLKRFFFG